MNDSPQVELPSLQLVKEARAIQGGKIRGYFPDHGPLRRELYRKHMEAIGFTRTHNEVMVLGGNRVGKSDLGSYCVTTWLTGEYPEWWHGRRWDRPIKMWACGDTAKTVRDIIQEKLLGDPREIGTGMIPRHRIIHTTNKVGTADAVEGVWVRHVSGQLSELMFKSYDQRREAFQGTSQDVIWDDEEPPSDIYSEQLLRTLTTRGLMLLTLTPLKGMTDLISDFFTDTDEKQA